MGNQLLDTIRRVGIFIICAQTLIHFRPNESYEKYMKLLVSVMVLVQLVLPIAAILQGKEARALEESVKQYEAEMQKNMEEISITSVMAEEKIETLTMEEIKTRLNNENTAGEGEEKKTEASKSLTEEAEEAESSKVENVSIEVGRIEVGQDE